MTILFNQRAGSDWSSDVCSSDLEVMKIKIDFVGLSLGREMACMEMTAMVAVPNVVVGSKLSNPQFHYCNHINFLSHKKSILTSFSGFLHNFIIARELLILSSF